MIDRPRLRWWLKRIALRLGLGPPLRALRRALLETPVDRRDREDNERLRALLSRELELDSCCIDVGAHEGAVLAEMVRSAPQGRHLAFEPLPALATRLAQRFPQVEVREAALSDRAGRRAFVRVRTRPSWSGFVQRRYPSHERLETITVATERLDDVVPEGWAPRLIKIDVEGAEREVLAGAIETLSRHRPIVVFEHGLGSADFYGTGPKDLWELLVERAGLRIFDLDGQGPYSLEDFERAFREATRVNFVARPSSA